jgi:hypothetical protein
MALSNNNNPMYLNSLVSNGFKPLTISSLLLLFSRQYYTVALKNTANIGEKPIYSPVLSVFYTFLLCCIFPLQDILNQFNEFRLKQFNLANTPWAANSLTAFLNYYYDNVNKSIYLSYSTSNTTQYISSVNTNEPLWISSVNTNEPLWINNANTDFISFFNLIVNVPAALYANNIQLKKIEADLNTLKPDGMIYTISPF